MCSTFNRIHMGPRISCPSLPFEWTGCYLDVVLKAFRHRLNMLHVDVVRIRLLLHQRLYLPRVETMGA